jgi:DNA-binding Xre family transcriptional regulator
MDFNPRNQHAKALVDYMQKYPMSALELSEKLEIDYHNLLLILKGYTRRIHSKTALKIDKFLHQHMKDE